MKTIEKFINGIQIVEVVMEDSDLSSPTLKQKRLTTCNSCEFIVNNDSCSKCACLLVNRVAYVESFCPEGKW